jgi:hypothetical protein
MKNEKEIMNLLIKARSGDIQAEEEIFSLLFIRFLPVVEQTIRRVSVLRRLKISDAVITELCREALAKARKIRSIQRNDWSLMRVTNVVLAVVDDFILAELTKLAKNGDEAAENTLFTILNDKLFSWLNRRRYEPCDRMKMQI